MNNVVLCPNCGGQKTVSKPTYISGDVNTWVGDTSLYPCPTCDGRGWIRVDSVTQEDFDDIKLVALGVMETADNLMDECTKRADKIKELESDIVGFKSAENEFRALVGDKDLRIADLESRREMVRKTYDAREEELLGIIDDLTTENQLIECQNNCMSEKLRNAPNYATWHSQAEVDSMRRMFDRRCEELATANTFDRKLLDDILYIVNPLIKSGAYVKPSAESRSLSIRMHELCQTVVQFRHKHNIVG